MFLVLSSVVRTVSINVSESTSSTNAAKASEEYPWHPPHYYLEVPKRILASVGGFSGTCVVHFSYPRAIIT